MAMGVERQTIIFADDHDVLYRSGTERVLNPAKRFEHNPVIKSDRPWDGEIAWTSVYRNPGTGRYQLWYQAFSGDNAPDRTLRSVVCYAESDDGIHFVKPELGLFPYGEFKKTNIVLIGNAGYSDRYANSVVFDPIDKDPKRRYKMAYTDFATADGKTHPGLSVAFSPDGIRWTKYSNAPVQPTSYGDFEAQPPYVGETGRKWWDSPLSMADAADILYDPVRKVFVNYGKMWIDGPAGGMYWKHAMGRTESKDFIHWSDPQLVCAPDDQDPAWVEFHTSPVFYYRDRYFCPNQILNRAQSSGVMDIELMVSRDGIEWERPYRRQQFIVHGEPGEFDSGSIFTNSTPVILDDEIRFYYGGYAGGATGAYEPDPTDTGIGFASIRLDRFAGIRPVAKSDQPLLRKPLENIGQVTTKPLRLSEYSAITVNANASEGEIRVELLDSRGRRVRGFTAEDALPITGDSLAHRAAWNGVSLSDLADGDYLVRLHLRKATVYALSLVSEGA